MAGLAGESSSTPAETAPLFKVIVRDLHLWSRVPLAPRYSGLTIARGTVSRRETEIYATA